MNHEEFLQRKNMWANAEKQASLSSMLLNGHNTSNKHLGSAAATSTTTATTTSISTMDQSSSKVDCDSIRSSSLSPNQKSNSFKGFSSPSSTRSIRHDASVPDVNITKGTVAQLVKAFDKHHQNNEQIISNINNNNKLSPSNQSHSSESSSTSSSFFKSSSSVSHVNILPSSSYSSIQRSSSSLSNHSSSSEPSGIVQQQHHQSPPPLPARPTALLSKSSSSPSSSSKSLVGDSKASVSSRPLPQLPTSLSPSFDKKQSPSHAAVSANPFLSESATAPTESTPVAVVAVPPPQPPPRPKSYVSMIASQINNGGLAAVSQNNNLNDSSSSATASSKPPTPVAEQSSKPKSISPSSQTAFMQTISLLNTGASMNARMNINQNVQNGYHQHHNHHAHDDSSLIGIQSSSITPPPPPPPRPSSTGSQNSIKKSNPFFFESNINGNNNDKLNRPVVAMQPKQILKESHNDVPFSKSNVEIYSTFAEKKKMLEAVMNPTLVTKTAEIRKSEGSFGDDEDPEEEEKDQQSPPITSVPTPRPRPTHLLAPQDAMRRIVFDLGPPINNMNGHRQNLTPSGNSGSKDIEIQPVSNTTVGSDADNEGDEEKEAFRYFHSVFELITSEYHYCCFLSLVNKVFIVPLEDKFGKGIVKRIFSTWTAISENHESFLWKMVSLLPDDNAFTNGNSSPSKKREPVRRYSSSAIESVSDIMKATGLKLDAFENSFNDSISLAKERQLSPKNKLERIKIIDQLARGLTNVIAEAKQKLKEAVRYISYYPNALHYIEGLSESKPQAQAFINQLEKDPLLKGLKLRDFLIKPVQRVCKYPLLVREMIKNCKDPETKLILERCQEVVDEVATHVNTMVQQYEEDYEIVLDDLKSMLKTNHIQKYGLSDPACKLIRASEIRVVDIIGIQAPKKLIGNDKIMAYLFGDQLLFVRPVNSLLKSQKLGVSMQIDFFSPLSKPGDQSYELEVAPLDGSQDIFQIYRKHNVIEGLVTTRYILAVKGAALRDGWVADLNFIFQQLKLDDGETKSTTSTTTTSTVTIGSKNNQSPSGSSTLITTTNTSLAAPPPRKSGFMISPSYQKAGEKMSFGFFTDGNR